MSEEFDSYHHFLHVRNEQAMEDCKENHGNVYMYGVQNTHEYCLRMYELFHGFERYKEEDKS